MFKRTLWLGGLAVALAFGVGGTLFADEPPPAQGPDESTKNPRDIEPRDADRPRADRDDVPAEEGDTSKPDLGAREEAAERERTSPHDDLFVRYQGQNLMFEQPRFGGEGRLFIRDRASDGWTVHRGANLEAILRSNTNFSSHPELAQLRSEVGSQTADMPSDLKVKGAVRTAIEERNLVFEPAVAGGEARLFVKQDDGSERLFTGRDIDAILAANRDLVNVEGIQALRTRIARVQAESVSIRPDAPILADVRYTPTEVILNSYEWRDGRWVPRTFRGDSLVTIRQRDPALRNVLLMRGEAPVTEPAGRLERVPETGMPHHPGMMPGRHGSFGLMIQQPSSCLNSQLRLGGNGVVVLDVQPGSRAAAFGLQPNDVLVEVNRQPIVGIEGARSALAAIPADSGDLVILRNGQRMRLNASGRAAPAEGTAPREGAAPEAPPAPGETPRAPDDGATKQPDEGSASGDSPHHEDSSR